MSGNDKCGVCFARYYCAGGCGHDNEGAGGSRSTPAEDMCGLRRRELELAAAVLCEIGPEGAAFLNEREIFPPKPCALDF